MKVAELTGPELDYWVAKAIGKDGRWEEVDREYWATQDGAEFIFMPHADWEDGGPLIEQYWPFPMGILAGLTDGKWTNWACVPGKELLVWAMRAIVFRVYGEEVSDPT